MFLQIALGIGLVVGQAVESAVELVPGVFLRFRPRFSGVRGSGAGGHEAGVARGLLPCGTNSPLKAFARMASSRRPTNASARSVSFKVFEIALKAFSTQSRIRLLTSAVGRGMRIALIAA